MHNPKNEFATVTRALRRVCGDVRCVRGVMASVLVAGLVLMDAHHAWAADPKMWNLGLPTPANELAASLKHLHNTWLLPLAYGVSFFVFALMAYVCYRFREKANPIPSKKTHFPALEVVWTVIPAVIVVAIMAPSIRTIRASADLSNTDVTVKAIGNQWFWSYEYPEHEGLRFDSYMIDHADAAKPKGYRRLMSVDNPMVIPADTKIRLQVASSDVLHNFSISEFAVRIDATPGYLREVPIYPVNATGTYYGFCSELCGSGHAYMPIEVHVVAPAVFARWITLAQKQLDDGSFVSTRDVLGTVIAAVDTTGADTTGADTTENKPAVQALAAVLAR